MSSKIAENSSPEGRITRRNLKFFRDAARNGLGRNSGPTKPVTPLSNISEEYQIYAHVEFMGHQLWRALTDGKYGFRGGVDVDCINGRYPLEPRPDYIVPEPS